MTKGFAVSVACAAAVAVGAVSLGAQTVPVSSRSEDARNTKLPFSVRSYQHLFERKAPAGAPALPAPPLGRIFPRPAIAPERTCDLIVVRPDLRLDPGFPRRPTDAGVSYGMRTGPALCR